MKTTNSGQVCISFKHIAVVHMLLIKYIIRNNSNLIMIYILSGKAIYERMQLKRNQFFSCVFTSA